MPGTDANLADLSCDVLRYLEFRIVQRNACSLNPRSEGGADGCQFDPARRAREQLGAKACFEPLNAARERRLAHFQRFGGTSKIPRCAYGEKILDFPIKKRHACRLSLVSLHLLKHIAPVVAT